MTSVKTRSSSISGDDDKIQQIISAMNERFDKFDNKLDQQSTNLTNECKKLYEAINKIETGFFAHKEEVIGRINILENFRADTIRTDRLNDVIVKNVPQLKQENLQTMFENICETIGFQHDLYQSVNTMFRLGKLSKNGIRSPPILIKFTTQILKQEFLSKYFSFGKLCLRSFGFESDDRVYINENLSPAINNIYAKALSLKKNKLIDKVVTKSGYIFVKFPGRTDLIKISNLSELPKIPLVASNTTSQMVSSGLTARFGSPMN